MGNTGALAKPQQCRLVAQIKRVVLTPFDGTQVSGPAHGQLINDVKREVKVTTRPGLNHVAIKRLSLRNLMVARGAHMAQIGRGIRPALGPFKRQMQGCRMGIGKSALRIGVSHIKQLAQFRAIAQELKNIMIVSLGRGGIGPADGHVKAIACASMG
ncbi:MAG: hypothetical protein AAF199_01750 [Pseudomonadota bacterium]